MKMFAFVAALVAGIAVAGLAVPATAAMTYKRYFDADNKQEAEQKAIEQIKQNRGKNTQIYKLKCE